MKDADRTWSGTLRRVWAKKLVRLVGGEPQNREQLLELLGEAKQHAILDLEALSMIEGVLQVSELQVRDIMIPRAQMVVVRRNDPLERIMRVVRESAHSRFPVIGDDRGEVIGLLLAKDLLAFCAREEDRRRFNIRDVLRAAVFVPESKRLNVLLKEFRASRNHMAIVVDEYGSAAGLLTIEDVLEQIVGEIEDEHDFDEATPIFKRSATEYTLKAHTPIDEFNEHFDSHFPEDEFDTIGGLVVNAMGHLPKRGESVDIGRFRFKVMRADSRRVHLLGLRLLPPTDQTAEGD
jgi:magnesium and cobalt transporter